MPTQQLPPDEPEHLDTQTVELGHLIELPDEGTEEWALIRYVGYPIGEMLPLAEGHSFGRGIEASIRLPEPEVSRLHARVDLVEVEQGVFAAQLRDLGSTNGTFVNGHKFMQTDGVIRLHDGDVIRVGAHAFKLKRLDEVERGYHAAVRDQTTVDPLTGVANRSTVLHQLEKHFDLAKRHKRPLSVILCDLDHFKRLNDSQGHAFGDKVLRIFGIHLMGRLRASDQVGRIGGEEFLVVLPETPGREAFRVADDLRRALEEDPINATLAQVQADEDAEPITCSLGVAEWRSGDNDPGALLARADVALYRAKHMGRNRVEFDA